MDVQSISNHFPFIYKPTQEIHERDQNYGFKVLQIEPILMDNFLDSNINGITVVRLKLTTMKMARL